MVVINMFVRIINSLLSVVGDILDIVLMAFPPSPFNITVPPEVSGILAKANYFIPLGEMVVIGETWLVAVGLFYLYSVYARWAKAIQ